MEGQADDLIIAPSGGANIILRQMGLPRYYEAPNAPAASVDVYWRYEEEQKRAARFLGNFAPGAQSFLPFNPTEDRRVVLMTISRSADGTPHVSDLADADEVFVLFQRETQAPQVTQVGAATATQIKLAVEGYSLQWALRRRLRIADNEAMSTNLIDVVTDGAGAALDRVATITRTGSGLPAKTIYVRVSHSSASTGNQWSAESPAQPFTFAASDGTGGSTGEGILIGEDPYEWHPATI
jgi:hypothetical protein